MTTTAKEKLLHAAASLFYNHGIKQTGINSITAKANVAKMSLYNNFPTKADLVTEYIAARHREWLDLYAARLARTQTPLEGVMAVFEAYQDHAECEYENGFRGCGLLNAAAEFGAGTPERLAVKQHKDEVQAILAAHLQQLLGANERVPPLALLLSFVLEGAVTYAGLEGNSQKLLDAKQMAQDLIIREMETI